MSIKTIKANSDTIKHVKYISYKVETVTSAPVYLRIYKFKTVCPYCKSCNKSCIEEYNVFSTNINKRQVSCSNCYKKYIINLYNI